MRQKSETYAVVIDLDSYAGNSERQMCAYMTGRVGYCQVGLECAMIAHNELGKKLTWFIENVANQPDDHGVDRPVKIEPTPGFFNDGMGQIYANGTDPDLVKSLYEKNNPGRIYSGKKYPAYRSIIIFFYKKPPKKIKDIISKRAYAFADYPRKCGARFFSKFKIMNIRFIKRITTLTVADHLI